MSAMIRLLDFPLAITVVGCQLSYLDHLSDAAKIRSNGIIPATFERMYLLRLPKACLGLTKVQRMLPS